MRPFLPDAERQVFFDAAAGGVARDHAHAISANEDRRHVEDVRRGTLMENKFVRTSTLATLVEVTIVPVHVCPRRTSAPENRMAKMRGGASPDATAGVGSARASPKLTFDGTATPCAAQAASAQAETAAMARRDIAS
jgi:hypothetical protein